MITPFKFLRNPLLITVDKVPIYSAEYFYSMNKEDIVNYTFMGERKVTPKYTITTRCIHPIYENKFKPDYDVLLYFKTKESAEFYKSRLLHWDEHVVGEEVFHEQSDLTLTFRR